VRRRVNLENEAHVQYSRSRAHTTSKIKPPTDVECASASMGFYAQKTQQLWGDVSLHEALNGQVGGHHSWGDHGRSAHRDWKAGYVARPSSSLAPLPGAFGDASQALFLVTRPESAGTCPKSRLSYPAPGRGANGRPCRPCAPRPGREAVAVHLFRVLLQREGRGERGEKKTQRGRGKPSKEACLGRRGRNRSPLFPPPPSPARCRRGLAARGSLTDARGWVMLVVSTCTGTTSSAS